MGLLLLFGVLVFSWGGSFGIVLIRGGFVVVLGLVICAFCLLLGDLGFYFGYVSCGLVWVCWFVSFCVELPMLFVVLDFGFGFGGVVINLIAFGGLS